MSPAKKKPRRAAVPKKVARKATPQGYDISQLAYSSDGKDFRHFTPGNLWLGWFQPFFDFVDNNADVIKAVIYIDAFWDAQKTWGPPYANGYWGDARVQANLGILTKWKTEIAGSRYLQAVPDLFEQLGYTQP